MAEFYVTYEHDGQQFIAIIVAPERTAELQFASFNELHTAMDGLGFDWELWSVMEIPQELVPPQMSADWLKKMAYCGRLKQAPKPAIYLAGQGGGGTGV